MLQDGFPPVTFIVREATHPYFTRRDADLVWRREITKEQVGSRARAWLA